MSFNWLDIVLAIAIGSSVIAGVTHGFARTVVGLATAVIAIVASLWLYGSMGSMLREYVSHESISNLLGFAIVFALVSFAGALLGRILQKLLRWTGLGWLDRLMGAGLGLVRGGLVAILMLLIVSAFTRNPPPDFVTRSRLAPYLIEASSVLALMAPRELRDAFHATYERAKKAWQEATGKAKSAVL